MFEQIKKDLLEAMKAQNKEKLGVIRMLKSALQLEEIEAPVGYNKLTSRVEIIISKINNDKTFRRFITNVENYTGSQLPETGGIGTTLFLTLGSILVIGFGLLLVTKLRVYKENI